MRIKPRTARVELLEVTICKKKKERKCTRGLPWCLDLKFCLCHVPQYVGHSSFPYSSFGAEWNKPLEKAQKLTMLVNWPLNDSKNIKQWFMPVHVSPLHYPTQSSVSCIHKYKWWVSPSLNLMLHHYVDSAAEHRRRETEKDVMVHRMILWI